MVDWKKVIITTALGAGSGASIGLLRIIPNPEYGYGHSDFLIHAIPGGLIGALIGIAMGD